MDSALCIWPPLKGYFAQKRREERERERAVPCAASLRWAAPSPKPSRASALQRFRTIKPWPETWEALSRNLRPYVPSREVLWPTCPPDQGVTASFGVEMVEIILRYSTIVISCNNTTTQFFELLQFCVTKVGNSLGESWVAPRLCSGSMHFKKVHLFQAENWLVQRFEDVKY